MNRTIKILKDTAHSLIAAKKINELNTSSFIELKAYASHNNKYFYNVKVLSSKNAITHYDRLTKCIVFDINKDCINKKGKYTSFFHELGHHIDWELGLISNNNDFKNIILKECKLLMDRIDINTLTSYISKEARTNGLSDILSGTTNNSVAFKYKHTRSYWKGSAMRLPFETFAHFYEALTRKDNFKIELYRKFLPNSYNMFLFFINNNQKLDMII
ncbi:MAG: hypothetical protein E7214_15545 [Clostridium sp.]|nr:hypothetical protein [Clostridium sp.]